MILPFIHAFNKVSKIYGMLQMLWRKKIKQRKRIKSEERMEVQRG